MILVEVRSLIETDWLIYAELRRKEAGRSIIGERSKGGDGFYFGDRSSIKIELSYCMEDDGSESCYKPFYMRM